MPSARADVFFVLRNLNGGTFPSSEESVLAVLKEAYASGRYKMPICFEASPGTGRLSRFKINPPGLLLNGTLLKVPHMLVSICMVGVVAQYISSLVLTFTLLCVSLSCFAASEQAMRD